MELPTSPATLPAGYCDLCFTADSGNASIVERYGILNHLHPQIAYSTPGLVMMVAQVRVFSESSITFISLMKPSEYWQP